MRIARFTVFSLVALMAVGLIGCSKKDLSSPKAAAKTFVKALQRGDAETAKAAVIGGDTKLIDSMAANMPNMKKFKDALKSKFGDNVGKSDPTEAFFDDEAWNNAEEKITGDTATLTVKDGGDMKLKKSDGDWKIDASDLSAVMGGDGGKMFDKMGKAAADTAAEVDAGKYKSADEAKEAMGRKMMGSFLGG